MAADVLRRITDQVYRLEDRFVNVYLIDLGKVVLVDTGTRKAEDLIRGGLRELGKEPEDIAALLLTHHHVDHVGTAGVWKRESRAQVDLHRTDASVTAHRERRRTHGAKPSMKVVAAFMGLFSPFLRVPAFEPDRALDGGEVLDILSWPVEVIHVPGHTLGSCAYYARQAGILFAGDAVNGRHGTPEPPIIMEDVAASYDSFRKLTALGAPILLPGHGSPVRQSGSGSP